MSDTKKSLVAQDLSKYSILLSEYEFHKWRVHCVDLRGLLFLLHVRCLKI